MDRHAATAFFFAIVILLQIGLAHAQPFALTGLWSGVLSPKDRVYPSENNASTITIVLDITQNGNSFKGTLGWAVVGHPEQFIRYNVDGQILPYSNQATLKLDSSGRPDNWLGSSPCPTNMAGLATRQDRGIYLSLGRSSSDGCPFWIATLKLVRGAPDMLPILADRVVKAFNKGSLSEKASALASFASACVFETSCRNEVLRDPRLKTWAQVEAVFGAPLLVEGLLPAGAINSGEASTVERALVSAARTEARAGAATSSRGIGTADQLGIPRFLSPRQDLHIPPVSDGRSVLSADPSELLQGLHNGDYTILRQPRPGQVIVDFGEPVGEYWSNGTRVGQTQYGSVLYGKNGVHIVPANPIQR